MVLHVPKQPYYLNNMQCVQMSTRHDVACALTIISTNKNDANFSILQEQGQIFSFRLLITLPNVYRKYKTQ